eukprot:scaffold674_cov371-Prasinococcus_capsulatus_cf.AAC.18
MVKLPNILVCGTPGTGKSTLCETVAQQTGLEYIDVGKVVKERGLHSGYDEEFDAYILDEDKVCDDLEEQMSVGGNIVEHHSCDFFPERWFDLADNTILYDRLVARGYSQKKIEENVECEIMQVVAEEAADSYSKEVVQFLNSNSVEDMDANAGAIQKWLVADKQRKEQESASQG